MLELRINWYICKKYHLKIHQFYENIYIQSFGNMIIVIFEMV